MTNQIRIRFGAALIVACLMLVTNCRVRAHKVENAFGTHWLEIHKHTATLLTITRNIKAETEALESDARYEEVQSRARTVGELCEKLTRELDGHDKSYNAGDFYQILTLLHDLDREVDQLGGDALAIWAWSSSGQPTRESDKSRIWELHLEFSAQLSLLDATFAILLWDMGNLIEGKPLHLAR